MAYNLKKGKLLDQDYEQYRQLVELSPIAICIQSDNKIVFMNTAGAKLFGAANPEQLIGKSVTDFLHSEHQGIVKKRFQEIEETAAEVPPFEEKLIRADGTEIDIEITATPFNYQNNPAVQIVFYIITKRKKFEKLVFQSRIDWENTFNFITDMITIHDKDFNIIHANKASEKILNLPILEFNKEIKCFKYYHGTTGPPQGCPSCKCLKTGKPATFEMFEPHLDMFIEIRAMPRFNDNNQLIGLIHIVRDITERKRVEGEIKKAKDELEIRVENRTSELRVAIEQLREEIAERKRIEEVLRQSENEFRNFSQEFNILLDAIPDNLILLSPELKVMWSNKAVTCGTGINISEIKGQYCYKLCCNLTSPCKDCPAIRSFRTGKAESNQLSTPDGRFWDIRAFPIKDESGRVKNVIEVATDITEKVNLQTETMRTRQLASLGELAAGVAHEINNPINNIINYAQILLDEYERENRDNDILHRVIKDGDRIATIVRSLLSFARIRKKEKSIVDLHEIFSDMFSLIVAQIQKDGINLKVDVPPDLPKVFAHPQQIQQVFLNIISNSRFALNEKYPGIHENKILDILCEKTTTDNNPWIRIIFHDRGTGIPANIFDKVMDPFFSTKPSSVGTGLGLSISHGIISEHGGKLMIDSIEGKFTKVTIELPARMENEE
jgi:PAS domain S-box-containing protein